MCILYIWNIFAYLPTVWLQRFYHLWQQEIQFFFFFYDIFWLSCWVSDSSWLSGGRPAQAVQSAYTSSGQRLARCAVYCEKCRVCACELLVELHVRLESPAADNHHSAFTAPVSSATVPPATPAQPAVVLGLFKVAAQQGFASVQTTAAKLGAELSECAGRDFRSRMVNIFLVMPDGRRQLQAGILIKRSRLRSLASVWLLPLMVSM